MISAFLESIKYVGHLVPISLLRVYMGYVFLSEALTKVQGDFLLQPRLAAEVSEWLPQSSAPLWYKGLVGEYVVEHWKLFAYAITYTEFVIAISLLLGFLVRPIGLLGLFLSLNYLYNSNPLVAPQFQLYIALFFTLIWLGAGRCLGFDYFFFKRQRGIWW